MGLLSQAINRNFQRQQSMLEMQMRREQMQHEQQMQAERMQQQAQQFQAAQQFDREQLEFQRLKQRQAQELAQKQFQYQVDQQARMMAQQGDAQLAEARAAFGTTWLQLSPEDKEAYQGEVVNSLKQSGIINDQEYEQMLKADPGQMDIMAKMAIITSEKALNYMQFQQEERKLEAKSQQQTGTTRVFDPQTGNIVYESQPLEKPTRTSAQKELMGIEKDYSALQDVMKNYDEEYLTWAGQAKVGISSLAEKARGTPLEVPLESAAEWMTGKSPEERETYIEEGTKFLNTTEQFFQRYRKHITGAQAAIQELAQLRASFLSGDMAPSQFRGAISAIMDNALRDMEFYKEQLREGQDVSPGNVNEKDLIEAVRELRKDYPELTVEKAKKLLRGK